MSVNPGLRAQDPPTRSLPEIVKLLHRKMRMKSAFSVDADDLKRLSKLLQEFGPDLWNVELSDGTVMERIALDDVLAIPNGSTRINKVVAIATQPTSQQWGLQVAYSASVSHGSTKVVFELNAEASGIVFTPCSVEASGDKVLVEAFWKQVHEWLRDVRPGYSRLASATFAVPITGIVLFSLLSMFVVRLISRTFSNPHVSAYLPLFVCLGLLCSFLCFDVLQLLKSRLFPIGEFAFGRGDDRRKSRRFWRSSFGVLFLLSVLASVVASVIYAGIWS
jgi:hypothetical protein